MNKGTTRRPAENAKNNWKDTKISEIASTVSARDYGSSEAILMIDEIEGNNVKGRGVMIAEIEHVVQNLSVYVVLLWMFFFVIGYAMGANAIHSIVANVPEAPLLIVLALTATRLETIGWTSCTCSETSTLTQNNFINGTATSTCTIAFLCILLFPIMFEDND
jgi:hypothetical protein